MDSESREYGRNDAKIRRQAMRINLPHKSIDIEVRDINYILGAFARSYLFGSRNEDPEKIIFPMYPAIPHPFKPEVMIPVEWINPEDQFVTELAKDGSNIPEVTPEQEAALDATEDKIKAAKTAAENPKPAAKRPTKKATNTPAAIREPKMPPGGDIGSGHPDNLGSRDPRFDKNIKGSLIDEPDVDESKEKDTEIEKPE
jgi:hypothetical protein